MICRKSSCLSGAVTPYKDQRRQGPSCRFADIDGMQVEKATGCKKKCEGGEKQRPSGQASLNHNQTRCRFLPKNLSFGTKVLISL